jgi:hypothetical protein
MQDAPPEDNNSPPKKLNHVVFQQKMLYLCHIINQAGLVLNGAFIDVNG